MGTISTANGSAMVKLGETTVVCGIKAELSQPTAEEPGKGFIVSNVDFPPLCASNFKPGPPNEQAQVFSQQIYDIIESSQCLLKEDLCIKEEKLVWCLYIDIICLNYDGSVMDACITALTAALLNTKLPIIEISAEDDSIIVQEETEHLKVHHQIASLSFAVFDNQTIIADPTKEEESCCMGTFIIALKEDSSICCLDKSGGCGFDDEEIHHCFLQAKSRGKHVLHLISETAATTDV